MSSLFELFRWPLRTAFGGLLAGTAAPEPAEASVLLERQVDVSGLTRMAVERALVMHDPDTRCQDAWGEERILSRARTLAHRMGEQAADQIQETAELIGETELDELEPDRLDTDVHVRISDLKRKGTAELDSLVQQRRRIEAAIGLLQLEGGAGVRPSAAEPRQVRVRIAVKIAGVLALLAGDTVSGGVLLSQFGLVAKGISGGMLISIQFHLIVVALVHLAALSWLHYCRLRKTSRVTWRTKAGYGALLSTVASTIVVLAVNFGVVRVAGGLDPVAIVRVLLDPSKNMLPIALTAGSITAAAIAFHLIVDIVRNWRIGQLMTDLAAIRQLIDTRRQVCTDRLRDVERHAAHLLDIYFDTQKALVSCATAAAYSAELVVDRYAVEHSNLWKAAKSLTAMFRRNCRYVLPLNDGVATRPCYEEIERETSREAALRACIAALKPRAEKLDAGLKRIQATISTNLAKVVAISKAAMDEIDLAADLNRAETRA